MDAPPDRSMIIGMPRLPAERYYPGLRRRTKHFFRISEYLADLRHSGRMVYMLSEAMKLRSETMALDIKEIKLNKRQEKQIMDAAREKGRIYLILDGEKVKLSAKDAGDDVTVIDFGNDYYEELLTTLGDKGIVPSKELNKAIEKVLSDEKVYEDGEFFKAIARDRGCDG